MSDSSLQTFCLSFVLYYECLLANFEEFGSLFVASSSNTLMIFFIQLVIRKHVFEFK